MSTLNLSCPFPDNISPLSPNGFMFQIEQLPELTYFCQQITIPSISLPIVELATPFLAVPFKGSKLEYDTLTIQFLVDSEMKNYKAVHDWLTNGFPGYAETEKTFSDAFLHILTPSNDVVRSIQFIDIIPLSIEGLTFASTSSDVQYLVGSVTFRYTYYKFV